jgi:Flp pilus assembly protein TadG
MSSVFNRDRLGATGVTSLEFALVSLVFFPLFLGITDIARYLLTDHSLLTLMYAAERATILQNGYDRPINGAQYGTCSGIGAGFNNTPVVVSNVAPMLSDQTYVCVSIPPPPSYTPGTVLQMQVTASTPFTWLFPGVGSVLPTTVTETEVFTF